MTLQPIPLPTAPARTISPEPQDGHTLPFLSPLSFFTKFPVAAAPITQAAERVWPDKPAPVS